MSTIEELLKIIDIASELAKSASRESIVEEERSRLRTMLMNIEEKIAFLAGKGGGSTSLEDEINAISAICPYPRIIFDVGSNIGKWSQFALSRFSEAKIYAYEPQSIPFNEISNFCKLTSGRCTVEKLALSDKIGFAPIYGEEPGTSWGSLHQRDLKSIGFDFEIVESVLTSTVDQQIFEKNIEFIDILKIDVEGHELSVLRGASNSMEKIGCIQFEFGGTMVDSRTFMRDIVNFLTKYNFRIFRITPFGNLAIDNYDSKHECFEYTNYIAVSESRLT